MSSVERVDEVLPPQGRTSDPSTALQIHVTDYLFINKQHIERQVANNPAIHGLIIAFAILAILGSVVLIVKLKRKLW